MSSTLRAHDWNMELREACFSFPDVLRDSGVCLSLTSNLKDAERPAKELRYIHSNCITFDLYDVINVGRSAHLIEFQLLFLEMSQFLQAGERLCADPWGE